MLVRKFLRCKLTETANNIINKLPEIIEFKEYEKELIKQSLYQTEKTWEMEP